MKKTRIPDSTIDDSVRTAFEKATPDVLPAVKADLKGEAPDTESLTKEPKTALILNNRFRRFAAVAAAIVLIVGGVLGAFLLSRKGEDLITVTLEVNPEIELTVGRDGKVTAVSALNDDGTTLLEACDDFVGDDCTEAVLAIVDRLIEKEYIVMGRGSVLITVSGGDKDRRDALGGTLEEAVGYRILDAGIDGNVICRSFDGNDSIIALAERQGISVGKAQVIDEILGLSDIYTELELSRLSVHELGGILKKLDPESSKNEPVVGDVISFTPRKDVDAGDPELTPTALPEFDPDKDITKDEAKELVLAHSGAVNFPVLNYSCTKNSGGEVPVYDVKFICDKYEFEYTVQIRGGVILHSEKTERDAVNILDGMTVTSGESGDSVPFSVSRYNGAWGDDLTVITSKKEFYSMFSGSDYSNGYDGYKSGFISDMSCLRDSFFDEYTLLLYPVSGVSSSVSYSISDLTLKNGILTVSIEEYNPQWQNADLVNYTFVIAVKNEDIAGCTGAVTSKSVIYEEDIPPFGEDQPVHEGSDGTDYMMCHYNYLYGSTDAYFAFDISKYALNADRISATNRPIAMFSSREMTRAFVEDIEATFPEDHGFDSTLSHDMLRLDDEFYREYTLFLIYMTETGNRKFITNIVTDVRMDDSALTVQLQREYSGWGTEKKFLSIILVAVENDDIEGYTTANAPSTDVEKSPLSPPVITETDVTTEPVTEPPVTTTEPVITDPPVVEPPVVEPPVVEPPVTVVTETTPPETTTEPPVTEPPRIITADEAKETVFSHAKVGNKLVLDYECEEDTENGIRVFEIEFTCGGFEYDYTVKISGGEIIRSEKETCDDSILDEYGEYAASETDGAIPFHYKYYDTGYHFFYKTDHTSKVLFIRSRAEIDAFLSPMQALVDEFEARPNLGPHSGLEIAYDFDCVSEEFFKTHTIIIVPTIEGSGSISNTMTDVTADSTAVTVHIERFEPRVQTADMAGNVRVIVVNNSDIPGVTTAKTSVTTVTELELAAADPFYYYNDVVADVNSIAYRFLNCADYFYLTDAQYKNMGISEFAENENISEAHPAVVKFSSKAELDAFLETITADLPKKQSDEGFIKNLSRIPEEHFEENTIILVYLIDTSTPYTAFHVVGLDVEGASLTVNLTKSEEHWNSSYYQNTQFIITVANKDIAGVTDFDTVLVNVDD